jgi:hypothetical protein
VGINRVAEFTALVKERLDVPELASYTFRDYDPPPEWAAALVIRAKDQGILDIRAQQVAGGGWSLAYVGPLVSTVTGGHRVSTVFWTYNKADNSRMFAREAAISLAAAARLVLDFGHPVEAVQLESDGGAVDGVAFDRFGAGARPILGIEAKVRDPELRALVKGVAECGGVGDEEAHRTGMRDAGLTFEQNWPKNQHRKCPFLLAHQPVGFWVVSEGLPDGEVFVARPIQGRFILVQESLETLHRDRLLDALGNCCRRV